MRKSDYRLLPYETVLQAVNGNSEAINIVIKHYSRYINSLAKRVSCDNEGNKRIYIDEYLKQRIETKLIYKLANFNI